MDDEHCYRAASSRDGRFDGAFFTAVLTTGIYCRPSCPAVTPKRQNVRFYPTAAAAQEAGFRACKRCRPDAAPGSPEWVGRADVVARAMRLIGDGVIEREGVAGLASRLGYSPRQLHRLVFAELGTGPLSLARARRVQHARMLLETTDLTVTDVAWASGFGSIRQFNDCIRQVYDLSPTDIRKAASRRRSKPLTGQGIEVQLAYRPPMRLQDLLTFMGERAVPGLETWDGSTYARVMTLPHGEGYLSISTGDSTEHDSRSTAYAKCTIDLQDTRDFITAVARIRSMLDLDADPVAVDGTLAQSEGLRRLIELRPGLRVPGSLNGTETALRAVLGQQVSVAGARTLAARLVNVYGKAVERPRGGLTHGFPSADIIAAADPSRMPLPHTRATALVAVARSIVDGRIRIDPGADRDDLESGLKALRGVGQWTASYVRMRGLGDPDVFLAGDLGIKRALAAGSSVASLDTETWRPWRSYATVHLWTSHTASPSKEKQP